MSREAKKEANEKCGAKYVGAVTQFGVCAILNRGDSKLSYIERRK